MKKHTRDEFPITAKKRGVTVKIYQVKNRKTVNYCVAYIGPDGRQRRNFADLDEAKREAANIADKLAGFDAGALRLNGNEALKYQEAQEAIAASGCILPLNAVAHEYARARQILGADNIVEAARYYKKHVDADLPQVMVADAVQEFYEAKKTEGARALYLKDIRVLLGDFAENFQCPLSSIQTDDLWQYLNGKRVGYVSKENRRRMLVALFNWAKSKKGWLRKNEDTAADDIDTYAKQIKEQRSDPEVYAPGELQRLLNAAGDGFMPYLALRAFAGIRREELHKDKSRLRHDYRSGLTWDAIDFNNGEITVPAGISKTKKKRKIELQENLRAWLEPYSMESGPIFNKDPRKRMAKVAKASGVTWKPNGLRDTFASYRLEQTKNEGLVALEMGNSPKMVKERYADVGVTAESAREYWSIKPLSHGDRKIVAIR